jgi:hypothetical protein
VTHDLWAVIRAPPGVFTARDTGDQKWLREPFSLNASVVRCLPSAIDRSSVSWFVGAAAMQAVPSMCIR